MNKPLTLIALALLGVSLGYFLVLLLPVIFVTWLEQEINIPESRLPASIEPLQCDTEDEGVLSPIWDSDKWIDEIQAKVTK